MSKVQLKPFKEGKPVEVASIKVGQFINHGDVTLRYISESILTPNENAPTDPEKLLALGEFSGHAHKIFDAQPKKAPSTLYVLSNGKKLLTVTGNSVVKHQEHMPVKLPNGTYEVGIRREWDPFAQRLRQVAD